MESRALVAEALLPGTEGTEVFAGLRTDVRVQRHDDTTGGTPANRHVKENILLRHSRIREEVSSA